MRGKLVCFLVLCLLLVGCSSATNRDNRLAFVINETYTDSAICIVEDNFECNTSTN